MKRRLLVLAAVGALAAVAIAPTAGADPTNAKNARPLPGPVKERMFVSILKERVAVSAFPARSNARMDTL